VSGFAGMRVLVVGLGASGAAAARVLHRLDAKVRVTEASSGADVDRRARELRDAGVEVEVGGHDLDAIDADLAIVSPGIPPTSQIVEALRSARIETIGEVELAFRLARCDFLAITGTNGKTTTTSLLATMLEEAGIPSVAAGNIGLPAVEAVGLVPRGGAIALEVSSFQLATIERFHPRVAVVLNVAEDHTDWHGSFASYAAAKERISENQGADDVFVFNALDDEARRMASRTRARTVPFSIAEAPPDGIGVQDGEVFWRGRSIFSASDVALPGVAGLEDSLAAAAAALSYGVDVRPVVRGIKGFRALRHRLEIVAEIDGVTFIDDSKATNPHAAIAAAQGLHDVVLIAGGRAKGIDLSVMRTMVPPVSAVVALGEAADEIARAFEGAAPVEHASDMEDAVRRAAARSRRGGSVLLAPGCASLDMYTDYAARGEAFVRAVKTLVDRQERSAGGES
jgi:UDP-N-acetylmuramoylalanine--D-glutamate ligase